MIYEKPLRFMIRKSWRK